jgi:hypothetical protein
MRDFLIRKFKDAKPGLVLSAVLPSALPVRIFSLKVLVSKELGYSLGGEFVLRAINAEVRTTKGISDFLGLDPEITGEFVAMEIHSGNIHFDESNKLRLTERGLTTLGSLVTHKMINTKVDVQIDQATGLLKSYLQLAVKVDELSALTKGEVGPEEKLVQLNPQRQDRPTKDFFDLHVLNSFQGSSDTQIVEVYGLVARKKFQERLKLSWLLVYVEPGTGLHTCELVIDGEVSVLHQHFVNEGTFLLDHGLVIDEPEQALGIVDVIKDLNLDQNPDAGKIIQIYRELEDLDAGQQSDSPEVSPMNIVKDPIGAGKFLVQNQVPARLSVFEHPKILDEALRFAKSRIFLMSPWITYKVVNDNFINLLKKALARGVEITIVFGYEEGTGNSVKSLKMLLELQSSGLNFLRHQNTHAKLLIVDNTSVFTSFNWLSFMGDKDLTYRMEEGTEVRSKEFADKMYADLILQMSREAKVADHSIFVK